ncbi:hypothetical protein [Granulicella sibirica]|uniref:Uncharacterized protein n=1 Tax=Granulicella sibirica TaxID=2479048 RepID=A0A4Q0SZ62_9BACT|nr:hypothetical protein [Granulicella sibirica]RXH56147.1 hypothetical protein GRAN_3004 [Granulicella sibirica]
MSEMFNSPFVVPVAACAMVLGIVIASRVSDMRKRQLEYEERMALIAKGMPLPPISEPSSSMFAGVPPELMSQMLTNDTRPVNMQRRIGLVRRWGIVLVASAVGIALFFIALGWILSERDVLSGAACALIPFAIGIGLLIDAGIQKREIVEGAELAGAELRRE